MKENGKLVIPAEVLAQITFLHASIGKTEWSGVLFYDVINGNPSDPKGFKLEVKYIYLMDIGSAAYTEYEPDGDLIDMYDKYEKAIEWKTGHIHTHHSMGAYFSGTDDSELKDNVDKYNYYLSLIVSFDGDYEAKVAFLSDVDIESSMSFNDDDGKKQVFKSKETEKKMVTIDMDIIYGTDNFTAERVIGVKKKIKEAAEKKKATTSAYGSGFGTGYGRYGSRFGSGFGKSHHDDADLFTNRNLSPVDTDDVDPEKMTTAQVEKLTRNIIAANVELKEVRAVYSVLSSLVDNNKEGDLDIYYNLLGDSIGDVLDEFFEMPLGWNELIVVMDEVLKSVQRFEGNIIMKSVINGITETISNYMEMKKMEEDFNDAEEAGESSEVIIVNPT